MRKNLLPLALAAALLIPSISASAWNHKGHMTVAYIAYNHLTAQEQNQVFDLLKSHPDAAGIAGRIKYDAPSADQKTRQMMLFVEAARWPDFIRSDDNFYDETDPDAVPLPKQGNFPDAKKHKPWHFMDEGFSDDGTKYDEPDNINAKTAIGAFRHAIGSPDVSRPYKAYFLAWLEHLVGDVHQPMHCVARFSKAHKRGDRGGNLFGIAPFKFSETDEYAVDNLHSFWDDVLGDETSLAAVAALAAQAEASSPANKPDDMDETHWIGESYGYAVYAYKPLVSQAGTPAITKAYYNTARELALTRVKLAGYRLASLIRQNLK
jgi:hypothetical protein